MRYLLLIISCLTGFFEQDRGAFYDQVLAMDQGYNAFLVVTLQASDSTAQTVIQNRDLYYHFRTENKCRSVAEYQSIVKEALLQNRTIPMTHTLRMYHVARLRKCPTNVYGSVRDLDRYFHPNGFIREGQQAMVPCLIRELFEQEIVTTIDPASGYFCYIRP